MLLPLAAALVALTAAADAPPAEHADQKIRIANPGYFDVAVCAPRKPTLPAHVNAQVLQAVLLSARPLALECLTDPKARGPERLSKLVVDATVADKGLSTQVTGLNVTPEGLACAKKAVDGFFAQYGGLGSANADPGLKGHVEFTHVAGVQPAAQLGVNEASDAVARVRLALPGWCGCFDPAAAPWTLFHAQMELAKPEKPGEISPTAVTLQPTGDPGGEKIAACLKDRIAALKLPAPSTKLELPFAVRLINGNVDGQLPGAAPDLQFAQYDLSASGLTAQMLANDGARIDAAKAFTASATAYNEHKKGLKLDQVAADCAAMVKADGVAVEDNQKMVAQAKQTHDFVAQLAAKEPAWAPAEAATAKRIPGFEAQLQKLQAMKTADEATCQKVKAEPVAAPTKKKGKK